MNFGEPTGFNGIYNMQDMTNSICNGADVGTTGTLRDIRDQKLYWVAKIKNSSDDNALCWMTQNLDLDFQENMFLTPDDSDVAENWTPGITQKGDPDFLVSTTNGESNRNIVQSYDPGYYVYTTPAALSGCGNNQNGLSDCSGWFLVNQNWTASNDANAT